MKLRTFSMIFFVAVLTACASSTPYKPAQGGQYGYRVADLGGDRHRVVFTQRSGDATTAMDYALLRAAELALLEGHTWFVVSDRQTLVDRERSPSVSIGASQQRVVEQRCGLLGCSTSTRPAMGASVGASSASSRREVQAILEIKLGSGEPPSGTDSYQASATRTALKSRLQVNS